MGKRSAHFDDDHDDLLKDVAALSDSDLERLMAGGAPPDGGVRADRLTAGTKVVGTVVEVRDDEILVELDGKNLGVIDRTEFAAGQEPAAGSQVTAEFVSFDRDKEVSLLSTSSVRKEVFWEQLRVGAEFAAVAVATNKGGLTVEIGGERAFMPISQIDLQRVETADLSSYVGRQLRCEVTQFDQREKNLVVSRRLVLEREKDVARDAALSRIEVGDLIEGSVTRLTDHGAFVDLGGVEGLLHSSKIREKLRSRTDDSGRGEALVVGQTVGVEVISKDVDRGRLGLDLQEAGADTWEHVVENYHVGDEVTGWLARVSADGVTLRVEDGVEGWMTRETAVRELGEQLSVGTIVRARITTIDAEKRRMEVVPIS